jgi:hypothetical protein
MSIMEAFPLSPIWTSATFNFNWVVAVGIVLLSIITWFAIGHKYKGAAFVINHAGAT